MSNILITGAGGLIGSEACSFFSNLGHTVCGIDNNFRKVLFGEKGCVDNNVKLLHERYNNLKIAEIDIRDGESLRDIVKEFQPDVLIHAAAQPSHDLAKTIPLIDFDINARGTLILLELVREFAPECIFIHMSTNKVYGDRPNDIELVESDTRFDYAGELHKKGISESFGIDDCVHSLFGVSKVAADLYVQEYSSNFDIVTCTLRCGCLTGPRHSGVEQHGFLNYLMKCNIHDTTYTVNGYKGKQVRDNIHSLDVVNFMNFYITDPRPGTIYNLGGGYANSCSILEASNMCENITGKKHLLKYSEMSRTGDHICYYSDMSKINKHYPEWELNYGLYDILESIYKDEHTRYK